MVIAWTIYPPDHCFYSGSRGKSLKFKFFCQFFMHIHATLCVSRINSCQFICIFHFFQVSKDLSGERGQPQINQWRRGRWGLRLYLAGHGSSLESPGEENLVKGNLGERPLQSKMWTWFSRFVLKNLQPLLTEPLNYSFFSPDSLCHMLSYIKATVQPHPYPVVMYVVWEFLPVCQ